MPGTVTVSLRTLDAEITEIAPNRTLPTWFLGDAAHKAGVSGHNPDDTPGWRAEYQDSDSVADIRAGDFRLPFNAPFTPEQLVQALVKLCREGKITWIAYIIFNKRIWSAKTGWVTRAYTGANKHEHHIHVSGKPDTASENNTKKVGLRAILFPPPPPREDDEVTKEELKAAVREVLEERHRFPGGIGTRVNDQRGWGPMGDRTVLAYLFEMNLNLGELMRAFVEYEKAEDAEEETRQSALDRLEQATARIEAAVTDPVPPGV